MVSLFLVTLYDCSWFIERNKNFRNSYFRKLRFSFTVCLGEQKRYFFFLARYFFLYSSVTHSCDLLIYGKKKYYLPSIYFLSFKISYQFGCCLGCMLFADDHIFSFHLLLPEFFPQEFWLIFCWSEPTQYYLSLVFI